ncbi:MAG: TRAP transporter substrate-binding protein [Desulfobulbaceae bacterium]|nr:TRAP transporter substrate-binding protein [Desulfobulbaceae bacterium]
MKYANMFPSTHIQSKLAESWGKAVEEVTQGRVKIEYYPGGSLLKGKQIFDGVVDGIADVGFAAAAYTAGRFPLVSVFDLPLGYPSGAAATKAVNDVYAAMGGNDFRDAELMYLHAHGPGFITTNGREVRTLADMRGLRIRSTGVSAEMVKALGGTPVAMEMGDTYESLQKGVVDGSAHPVESNVGWKLGEVITTMTRCYPVAYTTTFFVVMNKDKWAEISTADQRAIRRVNDEWLVKHGAAWDESDAAGLQELQARNVTIIDLDPAESAAWAVAVAPVIDSYAEHIKAKGVDGLAVVAAARQSLGGQK